jgi:transposase
MLIGAQAVRVWLVAGVTDMRRSIDGLCQAVVDALQRQPVNGEVFVFCGRRKDKVKLVWYDRHGFWLAYKRLDAGHFRWPEHGGEVGLTELAMLLEGIDLKTARLKRVPVQRVD